MSMHTYPNKHRVLFAALLSLLVSMSVNRASDAELPSGSRPFDSSPSSNVDLLREWEGGQCEPIAIDGDVVFAGFSQFLVAIDVSDKLNPVRISNIVFSEHIQDFTLSGNYAYVANGDSGVRVVDIADPANLVEVGADVGGFAQSIAISGNYAYVCQRTDGFRVLDITNPENPNEVGHIATSGWSWRVVAQGGYAYVTDFVEEELEVINVTDPENPYQEGSWIKPASYAYFSGLSVDGNFVYIAGAVNLSGLWVVDVSNPAIPTEAAHLSIVDCKDVSLQGNHAYVTSGEGLRIVDVSIPTAPLQVGEVLNGDGDEVAVNGDFAFVCGYYDGVKIIDVLDETSPAEIAWFRGVAPSHSSVIENDILFLRSLEGFSMADVSNPLHPVALSTEPPWLDVETKDLAASGSYVYLANCDTWSQYWGGIQVIDISDNEDPTLEGFNLSACLTAIDVSGSYAYTGGGDNFAYDNFIVYDISDPSSPTQVAAYDTDEDIFALDVSAMYAFLANAEDGLRVMDISDPLHPAEVGTYSFSGSAWDVAVNGTHAYLACKSSPADKSLLVIDVSTPTLPVEVGSYTTASGASNISFFDDEVYLTLETGDLYVIQVTDPANPDSIAMYSGGTRGRAAAAPPYFYVSSSRHDGFDILLLDTPTSVGDPDASRLALNQNYPNPFNPQTTISFELSERMAVKLVIYDIQGKRIVSLVNERMDEGIYRRNWDGTNDSGDRVSSGVYFCRLSAGGEVMTRKLILLK